MLYGFPCWIMKPLVLLGAWPITFSAVSHIFTLLYLVSNAPRSVCTRLSFTQPAHVFYQFVILSLSFVLWEVSLWKRIGETRWVAYQNPSAVVVVPAKDAIKP